MKLFYVVKTSPEPAQRNCLLTQKSAFDSMHVPMPRRVIKRPEHDRTEQIKFFLRAVPSQGTAHAETKRISG